MDVYSIIEEELIKRWQKKGLDLNVLLPALPTIFEVFDIKAVQRQVDRNIDLALNKNTQERYDRTNIKHLTELYVSILATEVGAQKFITSQNIINAKAIIKNIKECKIYPCG